MEYTLALIQKWLTTKKCISLAPIFALHVPAYSNPPQVWVVRTANSSTVLCLHAAHKY